MLCGLVTPTCGTARVAGLNALVGGKELRRRIGYMAQGFTLYSELTCEENLEFCARAYGLGRRQAREKKQEVTALTGLERYYDVRAGRLSGGWQRRLGLAAALLHDPDVFFLDEPTGGVDPVARRDLWDLFYALAAAGKTFFITTHDMHEAQRCSHIAYLLDGVVLGCGCSEELLAATGAATLEDSLVALVRMAKS